MSDSSDPGKQRGGSDSPSSGNPVLTWVSAGSSAVAGVMAALISIQQFLDGSHVRQATGIGLVAAALVALAALVFARKKGSRSPARRATAAVAGVIVVALAAAGVALALPFRDTTKVVADPHGTALATSPSASGSAPPAAPGTSPTSAAQTSSPATTSAAPPPDTTIVPPPPVITTTKPPAHPIPSVDANCDKLTIITDYVEGITTPLNVGPRIVLTGTDPGSPSHRKVLVGVNQPGDGFYPWAGTVVQNSDGGFYVDGIPLGDPGSTDPGNLGKRYVVIAVMDPTPYQALIDSENASYHKLTSVPSNASVVQTIPVDRVC